MDHPVRGTPTAGPPNGNKPHLHNEIWLVKQGVCELTINGVMRRMNAGYAGIANAGDLHYVRNAGDT